LQRSKLPSAKSFSCELNGVEDRVSARNWLKQPAPGMSRVMLMPPSKKLPDGKVPEVPNFGV
jgi:hypothetical protein